MNDYQDVNHVRLREFSLPRSVTRQSSVMLMQNENIRPIQVREPSVIFPPKENVTQPAPDKRRNASVWNDKLETAARDIGEMSLSYKMMHIEMAQRAHLKYNVLMYMGIILAPLSGIISQFNSPLSSCDNMYLSFTALGISFISGIVVAIIKFSRYDEVEYANKLAASKYVSLESNVRRQLALYRDNRIDAIEYMEWLTNCFDELFMSSPLLPHFLFNKYRALAKKNGHTLPNPYGNTININENYEQYIVRNICESEAIMINTMNSEMQSTDSTGDSSENEEYKQEIEDECIHKKITYNSPESCTDKQKIKETDEKSLNNSGASDDIGISIKFSDSKDDCQGTCTMRGNKIVKRTCTLVPFQELNKYSDPMMVYQMRRSTVA